MTTITNNTDAIVKSIYVKPLVVALNSQETAGGPAMAVMETNVNGTNPNRKMQSLGPPPS